MYKAVLISPSKDATPDIAAAADTIRLSLSESSCRIHLPFVLSQTWELNGEMMRATAPAS